MSNHDPRSHDEIVAGIHQEIASKGTSSEFVGHGLDIETGEYDADEIAETILSTDDN